MHPQTELTLKALQSLLTKPRSATILEQKFRAAAAGWSRSHNRAYGIRPAGRSYPYSSLRQQTRAQRREARFTKAPHENVI